MNRPMYEGLSADTADVLPKGRGSEADDLYMQELLNRNRRDLTEDASSGDETRSGKTYYVVRTNTTSGMLPTRGHIRNASVRLGRVLGTDVSTFVPHLYVEAGEAGVRS